MGEVGGWNKLLVWWCWGGRREYAGSTGGSGTGQFRSDGHGGGVGPPPPGAGGSVCTNKPPLFAGFFGPINQDR